MLRRRNAGCEYWRWKVKNSAGHTATSAGRIIACRLPEIAFHNGDYGASGEAGAFQPVEDRHG